MVIRMYNYLKISRKSINILEIIWNNDLSKLSQYNSQYCMINFPYMYLVITIVCYKLLQDICLIFFVYIWWNCHIYINNFIKIVRRYFNEEEQFSMTALYYINNKFILLMFVKTFIYIVSSKGENTNYYRDINQIQVIWNVYRSIQFFK